MPPSKTNPVVTYEQLCEMGEDINNYKTEFVAPKKKEIENEEEEEELLGGSKGSFKWKLGSYSSVRPIATYVAVMISYYFIFIPYDEPTNIPMSRKLLINREPIIAILAVGYVLFSLVWGPRMMKNRKPIKLKSLMIAYNLTQVAVCSYIFFEIGFNTWFHCLGLLERDTEMRPEPCNFFCVPEDRTDSLHNQRVANVVHLYFLIKMLDWCDTLFFILQKKWSHISFLHIFHHMGMFAGVWYFCKYIGSGHYTFGIFVNSFVHMCLYLYYFLALLGPTVRKYLWWKKYLTMLQLLQFTIGVNFISAGILNNCDLSIHAKINCLIYVGSLLLLFLDFYRTEYIKKPKAGEKTSVTNGKTNGEVSKKES